MPNQSNKKKNSSYDNKGNKNGETLNNSTDKTVNATMMGQKEEKTTKH